MQLPSSLVLVSLAGVLSPFGIIGLNAVGADSALAAAAPQPAAAPAAPAAAPDARDPRVVTIGDSIMAGYGLSDEGQSWPALLASPEQVDVTNLGCTGAGFIHTGTCGTDFDGLVAQAAAAHPSLVVVQASDNDLGQSAAAIDDAANTMIADLHAAVPGARIVGLSTLWNQPSAAPAEVSDSSDALAQAVDAVGGTFVDVGQPLAGHPGLLQADSEHPTVTGQHVLATAIARDLAAVGISN